MAEGVIIDGAIIPGEGHLLRTCLTLSIVSGRPVRIVGFRTGRPTPGLARAHVAAIRAAMRCSDARVAGVAVGSTDLTFVPGPLRPIDDAEDAGPAGAATLVLQTAAVPLALASGSSRFTVRGSTHGTASPTFDFLETDWLPAMEEIGLPLSLRLRRLGWAPRGGGEILALIPGNGAPRPISRPMRSNLKVIQGIASYSRIPRLVAERVASEARRQLRRSGVAVRVDVEERAADSAGSGVHLVAVTEDGLRTGFSVLDEKARAPERLAREAVNRLFAWLDTGAAVSENLADQILVPLALADGKSVFTTSRVTKTLLSTAAVVERFLPTRVRISAAEGEVGEITIER